MKARLSRSEKRVASLRRKTGRLAYFCRDELGTACSGARCDARFEKKNEDGSAEGQAGWVTGGPPIIIVDVTIAKPTTSSKIGL
jgi:hypothetical protein